jgi:putative ABC transport system ATP-binding protein
MTYLRVENIIFKEILDVPAFSAKQDEKIVCYGHSGSGKSLFLRTMCLLEAQSTLNIFWKGHYIENHQIPLFRSRFLYLSQRPYLKHGTVKKSLEDVFKFTIHKNKKINWDEVYEMLAFLGKDEDFLKLEADRLSGGESQLMALIRALILKPEFLCLDEPTSALDHHSVKKFEALVAKFHQGGRIWISHDPEQISRIGDRFIKVSKGRIISDQPRPEL